MGYEMDKKKSHNAKKKNKHTNEQVKQKIKEAVIEKTEEKVEETIEKVAEVSATVTESKASEAKLKNMLTALWNRAKNTSAESYRTLALAALKVVLPILALIIIVAAVISLVQTKNAKQEEEAAVMTEASTEAATVMEPLEVDAYEDVNGIISSYYNALATGDMDTVKSHMDYISDTDLLQLKNKNEFVEAYQELNCYTRAGLVENSYFVYVTYKAKFNEFDTLVPGVTTHYVYPVEDGSLKIAKEMDEQVNAALMVTSCQDDVVDIFNKVDVEYKEILASDEELNTFLTEMFTMAKTMTGEEIAKMESGEVQPTEETTQEASTEAPAETVTETIVADVPQSEMVNEEVKATTTVNVRSSDSENADKVGRLAEGEVVKRTEVKINGWSKVVYEGKEAYVKSDYLEVVSSAPVEADTTATTETATTTTNSEGTVKAKTNVNVRNKPSTSSDTIGKANGGDSYKLIENQGEWLKIEYKGQTGFVKAEYFE